MRCQYSVIVQTAVNQKRKNCRRSLILNLFQILTYFTATFVHVYRHFVVGWIASEQLDDIHHLQLYHYILGKGDLKVPKAFHLKM